MRRRIGIVILAIVLAVTGTAAVLAYVRQADQRALAGQKGVSVLVATGQIPAGTTASSAMSQGLFSVRIFPAASVPSDALSSVGPGLSSLVLSGAVAPGQLLTRSMLVTSAQSASGLAIPDGKIAVTLPFCLPEAVAGNLHPGSKVAVFDTYATTGATLSSQNGGCNVSYQQGTGSIRTRMVLPSVEVLAVGQAGGTSGTSASSPLGSGFGGGGNTPALVNTQGVELVTFAVSQDDAERLIQMAIGGVPYLALVTPSSGTAPDTHLNPLFSPLP